MMHAAIEYTRRGAGEPLVLIHGIGHRREAWNPIVDTLATRYDVFAIDLSGFGQSPGYAPGTPYSMDIACENLAANFAAWGIERPHVVGNSLGGAIALELGARGLARSVTALSPAGFFRGLDRLVAFGVLVGLKATSFLPEVMVKPLLRPKRVRRLLGRTLYEHGDRISFDDFLGDTRALRNGSGFFGVLKAGVRYAFRSPIYVPTTVAWGTRDKILLYGQAGLAAERLPEANHVALPGCGHVPMVDDPELVIRVIDRTAAQAGGAAAA
ncbi:MAG TPA: alpha/beta hydrolase [Aeromicrobium sp.]|nr:alpha/beta hydrolase [Aeromicrobium sp.]